MKLISLNIEQRKHWERVNPFLEAEHPDVICLQEIFEADAKGFAERFSMSHVYETMLNDDGEKRGLALFSLNPLSNIQSRAYHDVLDESVPFNRESIELKRATQRNVLITADVECDGAIFTIGTTHFSWTPDGTTGDYQCEDAAALLKLLADVPEVILCGDFNVPRGFNEVYDLFAAKYEDAIPKSYVTSLDPLFHRGYKGPIEAERVSRFMVDYLFLSKKYKASDVRLQSGLSDHYAIVATINT